MIQEVISMAFMMSHQVLKNMGYSEEDIGKAFRVLRGDWRYLLEQITLSTLIIQALLGLFLALGAFGIIYTVILWLLS